MRGDSEDLARLVTAAGTGAFGPAVMEVLHGRCGADMCSAFTVGKERPGVLLAESHDPRSSAFARVASLRYAHRYWRRDIAAVSTLGRAHRSVQVLKRSARGIRDLEYHHECYGEGAVTERLSLYRTGRPTIIANAYRERESGAFEPAHCERFAEVAPLLHAIIAKHAELIAAAPAALGSSAAAGVFRRLQDLPGTPLSLREAEVAALTSLGLDQQEIARDLDVRPSTVVTYRKRAYAKLGVNGRGQLRSRLTELRPQAE